MKCFLLSEFKIDLNDKMLFPKWKWKWKWVEELLGGGVEVKQENKGSSVLSPSLLLLHSLLTPALLMMLLSY